MICVKCSMDKDASCFYTDKTSTSGHRSSCKTCMSTHAKELRSNRTTEAAKQRRDYEKQYWLDRPEKLANKTLYTAYRITLEQYNQMLQEQDGVCAICLGVNLDNMKLSVDHNHKCCNIAGKSCGLCVRGLLCKRCNQGLGMFLDSPELLTRAAEYVTYYDQASQAMVCPDCKYEVVFDRILGIPNIICGKCKVKMKEAE